MIASHAPAPEPDASTGRADDPEIGRDSRTGPGPEAPDGGQADPGPPGAGRGRIDLREALYNGGGVGTAGRIQLPLDRITSLRGLLLDLDPDLLRPDNPILGPSDDPATFLRRIEPVLERHPLLRHAEARASGRGLHLIVRIDPPVELHTHGEQRYWDAIVKAVQRTLPAHPHAPGITALTRAVGSVNGKNGRPVVLLRGGRPVEPGEVIGFVRHVAAAPFRAVAEILLGAERADRCPLCRQPGLTAYDREGRCYRCGKVGLDRLFRSMDRAPEESPEAGGPRPGGRSRKGGDGKRGARDRD